MSRLLDPEQLWLFRTKPKDDESLSSWLVRLAYGLALKLQVFTTQVLKKPAGFWSEDVDRASDEKLMGHLSIGTGTPYSRVEQTSIRYYEGTLWPSINAKGPQAWLLPHRRDGRYRLGNGQQYCQECLREDREPYFRRRWRLAHLVVCDIHHCYLKDACPHCGSVIMFHAHDFNRRLLPLSQQMTVCRQCGNDVRDRPELFSQPKVPKGLLDLQLKLHKAVRRGYSNDLPGAESYSHLFFEGMRLLVRILISTGRPERLRATMLHSRSQLALGVATTRTRPVFEELRLGDRALALTLCAELLDDWPTRFVALCRGSRVSSSYIVRYDAVTPYWLESVVKQWLNDQSYAPSQQERAAVLEYLDKMGVQISENLVRQLLGLSHTSRCHRPIVHEWNPRSNPFKKLGSRY